MGRVNTPILTEEERSELETGRQTGGKPAFRTRCHVILLKAQGRTSRDVGQITGMSHVSVNSWLKRYRSEGLSGLHTRPGRGRKPALTPERDAESVLAVVRSHRQRLATAKAEWERQSGRSVSATTLRSFLKDLADDISG